jgi:peptide/nickel transport system permease protein
MREPRDPGDPPSNDSVAIALARKKSARKKDGRRARALAGVAPYTTVARLVRDRLVSSGTARAGACVLLLLAVTAIFAELLASDLPVLCRFHRTVYVLPNVLRPAALAGYDSESLAASQAPGDWSVRTPVHFGPERVGASATPFSPPSFGSGHWLGTDARGRDVFARMVYGTRTSLGVGLLAVVTFAGIGLALGALAGFFGGLLDAVVARIVETVTAFPTLIFVLVVQALLPRPTTYTLLLAIALTRWTEVARLVRAEVLLASVQDYSTAARALGASPWRVLFRHVLPNAIAPALVAATFGIGSVLLIEASLDFLRVGAPETVPSWGQIMSEARGHEAAWWLLVFPGAVLFATIVALNLVGEALRDALDPRLRDASVRATERPHEPPRSSGGAGGRSLGRVSVAPPSAAAFDESTHT